MDLEGLVAEARERRPQPMASRERAVAGVSAVAFLLAVVAIDGVIAGDRPSDPLLIGALVVAYAIASRVQFEISMGIAVPTQLVLIPMLFVAPLHLVPLLTAAGYLLGRTRDFVLKHDHADRWIHCFGHAWSTLGPVLVLGLLAPGPPSARHVGVYALALVAQISIGAIEASLGDRLMYGTSAWHGLRLAAWPLQIDTLLTPLAYMAAAVIVREPLALAGILPVFRLLHVFSLERKQRYAAILELNQAYRGTVMVLSDVVEAEDSYTADHCRSVVELAAAVGNALGVDHQARQELEIAALLHDVGKIAIPNEILNKPAHLTEEEFELMKTHTVEGQALLDRMGGKLARVGDLVRSCHERWDGRGYPDGLAAEQIPLSARIVFCCDAYSAMTTDRPYRERMSRESAIAELHANSGTQFDPRVVAAVAKVVAEGAHDSIESYSDAVRAVLLSQPARAGA